MDQQQLELEKRKLDLAEKELELKRLELDLKAKGDQDHGAPMRSPLGVAVIGGLLALFSGIFGSLIQGCNSTSAGRQQHESTAALERQKQEQLLIFKAIDTGGDQEKAKTQLKFLFEAGLLTENDKLLAYISRKGAVVPSITPPRTEGTATFTASVLWYKRQLKYAFRNGEPKAKQVVRQAFEKWQAACGLGFAETGKPEEADIKVSWERGDHGDGVPFATKGTVPPYGHAFLPPPVGGKHAGELHLNADTTWALSPDQEGIRLDVTALFFVGRLLGLDSSRDPSSVMHPIYDPKKTSLSPEDVAAIQRLYGLP